jgi:hypothetical protein
MAKIMNGGMIVGKDGEMLTKCYICAVQLRRNAKRNGNGKGRK